MDENKPLTDLLEIAAEVARRVYLPTLEKCRTIQDARREINQFDHYHATLAMKLKAVWDELERHYRAATPTESDLQRDANELLRQLERKIYGGITVAKIPEAVGIIMDWAMARAATKAETCPRCGSSDKTRRLVGTSFGNSPCPHEWHSPAPAPQRRRSEMAKCQQCKQENGVRVRCKLCHRMICDSCWSTEHNSDYCQRCQGEFNRVTEPAPAVTPKCTCGEGFQAMTWCPIHRPAVTSEEKKT